MRLTRKSALIAGSTCVVAALAVVLVLVLLSGVRAGPVSALSHLGQPIIDSSSGPVRAGQQYDATAFIFSSAHDRVTLLSASLVLVNREPAARLVHVGVYLNHSYDGGHASSSWPPGGDHVRPLGGAVIGHGQAGILFAFTGPTSGRSYTMAAGVKITYRWRGQVYTVIAWSAAVACGDQLSFARCGQLVNKAQDITVKQASSST
jgi:hypothetical protein